MKAIIFDCDGVLVDSESIYQSAHVKFLTEMGLTVPDGQYAREYMGLPTPVYFQKLWDDYGSVYGSPFPKDLEQNLKSYCHGQIVETLLPINGVTEFVEKLTIPYAVASSTKLKFLHQKLEQTNLHGLFTPHIYSGEQVPRGKPFPDLFLHAANMLKVAPQECVVVEDSVNGVLAGVAAGMDVIGFCGGGHCSDDHPNILTQAGAIYSVHDFDELAEFLGM